MSESFNNGPETTHINTPAARVADHGPNFQAYMYVFFALCVLTATSFFANLLLGRGHTSFVVIMLVSVVKATLVGLIFMHLKFDWPKVYCIIIPVSVMGVMMMIVLLPDIVFAWHHYFYNT
jgi:caa(3)-type oxidase subunit IV